MFYAEQKEYPYNFVANVTANDITYTEWMSDKVQFFDTRKKAEKYFKDLGWFNSVNIKSKNPVKARFYRGRDEVFPNVCEFDNRAHLSKFLKKSGLVHEYERVSITKSKVFDGVLVEIT